MLRYRLRTLLIVLAIGPLVLAASYWLWPVSAWLIVAAWPLVFVFSFFARR